MNPHTIQMKWFTYSTLRYLELWPQKIRNIEQVRWVQSRARGYTEE